MDEVDVLINDVWHMIFWCVNVCNWEIDEYSII
jgi:hypothetical protein